jgi:hypothetical protein
MGGTLKASPNSAKQTALHLMKNDYAQASELALAMDFAIHDWARQMVGVSETWLDWVVRFNSDPLDVRHKARWFVPAFACMSLFDWPAQTFVASIKMQQMVMHLIAEQSFSHADAGLGCALVRECHGHRDWRESCDRCGVLVFIVVFGVICRKRTCQCY